jgi:glycerophosphoryl diester phosphodiesterase
MPDPGDEKNLNVTLEKIKPNVIATDMGKLSESFVETAHKFNTMVFVDEKEGTILEWEKIISWGTDGIQTDKPAELLNFLKHKTGK